MKSWPFSLLFPRWIGLSAIFPVLLLRAGGNLFSAQAWQPINRAGLEVTNLTQLHALATSDAAAGPGVRLRGKVTFSNPAWNLFFVDDGMQGEPGADRSSPPPTQAPGVIGDSRND